MLVLRLKYIRLYNLLKLYSKSYSCPSFGNVVRHITNGFNCTVASGCLDVFNSICTSREEVGGVQSMRV